MTGVGKKGRDLFSPPRTLQFGRYQTRKSPMTCIHKLFAFILCGEALAGYPEWYKGLKERLRPSIRAVSRAIATFHDSHLDNSGTKHKVIWLNNYLTIIEGEIERKRIKEIPPSKVLVELSQISTIHNLYILGDYIDEYFAEQQRIGEYKLYVIQALDRFLYPSTIKYLLAGGFSKDQQGTIPELMDSFYAGGIHPIGRSTIPYGARGRGYPTWSLHLECHVGLLGSLQIPRDYLAGVVTELFGIHFHGSESFVHDVIKYFELLQTGFDSARLLDAYKLGGPNFVDIVHLPCMSNVGCRRKLVSSKISLKDLFLKSQSMLLDEDFCQSIKNTQNPGKALLTILIFVREARSLVPKSEEQWQDVMRGLMAPWKYFILDYFPKRDNDAFQKISDLLIRNKERIARATRLTANDLIDCFIWGIRSPLFYDALSPRPLSARKALAQEIECVGYEDDYIFKMCYMRWILTKMQEEQKWAALERYLNLPENSPKVEIIERFLYQFLRNRISVYVLMSLISIKQSYLNFKVDWMLKSVIMDFWGIGDQPSFYGLVMEEIDRNLTSPDHKTIVVQIISNLREQILPGAPMTPLDITDKQSYGLKEFVEHTLREAMRGTSIMESEICKWIVEKHKGQQNSLGEASMIDDCIYY